MRVLVVYGSKRGGTAELARMVGKAFAEHGWSVEVRPAADVASVTGADAVVVGGALYMNRWHRDAGRFVKRHKAALFDLPVWFFSSGPLDDSARSGGIAPVSQVNALASDVEIKGHMTFGGRLTADAKGFGPSGWREPTPATGATPGTCVNGCTRSAPTCPATSRSAVHQPPTPAT